MDSQSQERNCFCAAEKRNPRRLISVGCFFNLTLCQPLGHMVCLPCDNKAWRDAFRLGRDVMSHRTVRQATVPWWHCSSGGSHGWIPAEGDSAKARQGATGLLQRMHIAAEREDRRREEWRRAGGRVFTLLMLPSHCGQSKVCLEVRAAVLGTSSMDACPQTSR